MQGFKAVKFFYCYPREDTILRDRLDRHLRAFKQLDFFCNMGQQGDQSRGKVALRLVETGKELVNITSHT